MRRESEWSEGLKLMLIVLPTTLAITYLVGPLLIKYKILIPPLAVGGGIEMTYNMSEVEVLALPADSVHIQQLKNKP